MNKFSDLPVLKVTFIDTMFRKFFISFALLAIPFLQAAPQPDVEALGKSMGGWKDKGGKAARFEVSGSTYRCWKPEVSPTPTGGIFVSLRLDHLRGIFASDDHASLEITFDKAGNVVSASSSIALQGKKVTSDLIEGTGKLGTKVAGLDLATKVGAEMVANLSAKILRENIKEPGRVSFPAVLQHQYNLLCSAVAMPELEATGQGDETPEAKPDQEERKTVPLKIDPAKK